MLRAMFEPKPFVEFAEAAFRTLSADEGRARYSLREISDDSVDYDDLFGGADFEFAIHDGDLALAQPLHVRHSDPQVIIVDGDLVVDGALVLSDNGVYVPLWVTGALVARDLGVFCDAHLFVREDLRLEGQLVTMTYDAAHLVVHGEVRASAWLRMSSRGAVYLPASTPDPLEGDALAARWQPGLGGPTLGDRNALIERILTGAPLLR